MTRALCEWFKANRGKYSVVVDRLTTDPNTATPTMVRLPFTTIGCDVDFEDEEELFTLLLTTPDRKDTIFIEFHEDATEDNS